MSSISNTSLCSTRIKAFFLPITFLCSIGTKIGLGIVTRFSFYLTNTNRSYPEAFFSCDSWIEKRLLDWTTAETARHGLKAGLRDSQIK
jgi:hypothetical protein